MSHPVIPQIQAIAEPIAAQLGLEVVEILFQTNQKPPVLRIDIRNLATDTGLEDCEQMSRALDPVLEESALIPGAYVLEVSSPGIARTLKSDRDFISFKGFDVVVKTFAPFQDRKEWTGKLQGRDAENLYLNQKGKTITIPSKLVAKVQLA